MTKSLSQQSIQKQIPSSISQEQMHQEQMHQQQIVKLKQLLEAVR